MHARWLLLAFTSVSCARAGFDSRAVIATRDATAETSAADSGVDAARDVTADTARDPPVADAAFVLRSQTLSILTTKDDGEITNGALLFSGETWWSNLLHVGSWASGAPTITHVFLRYKLKVALPRGAKVTDLRLRLYGHALTGNSQWSPAKHKLIISADRVPSAAQVSSNLAYPGGADGMPQTGAVVDWLKLAWKVDAWNESPNLAPLVQELVDAHGGLKVGAYLQFWLRAPLIYPENAEVPFEDLDHANSRAAEATLKWSEPQ